MICELTRRWRFGRWTARLKYDTGETFHTYKGWDIGKLMAVAMDWAIILDAHLEFRVKY